MNKHFAALEQEGKVERVTAGRAEVDRLHAIVSRDLATAEELQARNRDWALVILYNALLQACVALMAAHGYRARGESPHKTIVEFARLLLPKQRDLVEGLDRLRRRRHRAVYDVVGQVSRLEVEEGFALARKLLPILQDAAKRRLAEGRK